MARKKQKRPEAQLAFDALSIEGGLLSPEWLSKVAQLAASHQTEPEYRIPKGLNLRDEIGRYWRMAQALWSELAAGRAKGAEAGPLAERFVLALLKDCLGFTTIAKVEPIVLAERVYPIGRSAIGGRLPVVVAPAAIGLDTLAESFADGKRRRSAFGLVQEYLNAEEAALWGIVCDAHTLRIARDNASLTRPAWIEADLARIFTEDRFADFAALWVLAHETRFGEADQPVHECPLETWREAGREQGTRARDKLRNGVEDALEVLGQGFLAHPSNQALRASLQSGELTTKDFFNQLLRLVYRVIFLLTVEERGLLHPEGTEQTAKQLYADGYSLRRLRERAVKRSAHDRFADLWEGTKIVLRGLALGEPLLGLPALAGIFAKTQCPALDSSKLENRHLLLAVFKLSWIRDDASLSRVNWRDMGPEELGSVYESLLELVPQIMKDGRQFTFASGGETKGNARKTSGSYYTPDSLVQVLLDSALEPVVADTIAKSPGREVEALLGLSIVDPACGSGHFLLAAARRLAAHVARLTANGTPSAAEYRHALRQVIGHCVYGVDLNPMAVELCRVSLWMEAVEPGLPLTFLSSHIQHGNALLGTTPELMAKGIPDAAWDPIEGDDKKVASALKKRNKSAAGGQRNLGLFGADPTAERLAVTKAVTELEAATDADVGQLAQKESRWDGILGSKEYLHQKLVADAWCSAFVWPKQAGALADAAPTTDLWRQIRDGQGEPPKPTVHTVRDLAERYRFFHWHLQFPHVFERGGFDVVLGNPPWERVSLKEKEWFGSRDAGIANAESGAARAVQIASLEGSSPLLYRAFVAAKRLAAGEKNLLRRSERFPLCGRGDVNTYAVFAELGRSLAQGRAGMVLKTGIATADTTQQFMQDLIERGNIVSFFDFDNRSGLFPAVQGNVRFCLLTTSRGQVSRIKGAAQLRSTEELRAAGRAWQVALDDIVRINPNTLSLPLFPRERDASLVRKLYQHVACLESPRAPSGWKTAIHEIFHMSHDSEHFKRADWLAGNGFERRGDRWRARDDREYVPLYEAKLCYQLDHRSNTFDGIPSEAWFGTHPATRDLTDDEHSNPSVLVEPRYWVPLGEVLERSNSARFLLGIRDAISAIADSRSLVATLLPPVGGGHTLTFLFAQEASDAAFVCAWLNAFATDYVLRLKASGEHASLFRLP